MTNSIIPFTFIPGTKANAEEVNQNFSSLAEKIQNVEVNTSENFENISNTLNYELDKLNEKYSDINLSNCGLISNCILEAPNGIAEYENSIVTIKSGLKLLIPNGRDENLKFKNIHHVLNSDLSVNVADFGNSERILFITNTDTCIATLSQHYFVQNKEPQNANSTNFVWFNPEANILKQYNVATEKWEIINATPIGTVITESEIVKKVTTHMPTSLLKQNDKKEISGYGMPSSKYIDLELGAANSEYIAPANGYYYASFQMPANTNSWYFNLDVYRNGEMLYRIGENGNEWWGVATLCPVLKGDVVKINYVSIVANSGKLRFIYAQGESEE